MLNPEAYRLAFKLAAEKLSSLPDLETQSRRSGSICLIDGSTRKIQVEYLNRMYQVSLPEIQVSLLDDRGPVELIDQILILHYLTCARGTPLTGHLIAYQELKEGAAYFPSFFKRAVKPLIDYFGNSPERLLELAGSIGASKAKMGDTAVTIPVFCNVPITMVIWRGDDEFPPNANILFDSTILDYLPVEDVNVVCQNISWHLVKLLSASNPSPNNNTKSVAS